MYDENRKTKENYDDIALIEMEQRAYSEMEAAGREMTVKSGKKSKRKKRVQYYIDGERVTARQVMRVQEEGNYMADFIYGKEGRIEEIHYDRIEPL